MKTSITILMSLVIMIDLSASDKASAEGDGAGEIKKMLAGDDVRPGFCLLLDVTDTETIASARLEGKYVVQALVRDEPENIRLELSKKGIYGAVSADRHDLKSLPYSDDMVNVIVVKDFGKLAKDGLAAAEILRVLAPYGTAFLKCIAADDLKQALSAVKTDPPTVREEEGWLRVDKPYPRAMDEWCQAEHDSNRSGVSSDALVGPPQSIRWIGGDKQFTGRYASPSVVTAGGRIFFTSNDRGYKGFIECRDAFNGMLIWKTAPQEGATAFASDGARLFVQKANNVEAWDAATGKNLFVFKNTAMVWAVRLLDRQSGIILLGCTHKKWLRAFDAKTGDELWSISDLSGKWSIPNTAIGGSRVYYLRQVEEQDKKTVRLSIRGVDLKTGKQESEFQISDILADGDENPSIVQYIDGRLILIAVPKGQKASIAYVISEKDGKVLWKSGQGGMPGFDGFLKINGIYWRMGLNQEMCGHDPAGGEIKKRIPKLEHVLCGPIFAAGGYLLAARNHLIDVNDGKFYRNSTTRVACQNQARMANGLIYYPRHTCACTHGMNDNVVLSAKTQLPDKLEPADSPSRLLKGPAAVKDAASKPSSNDDWPTYRANAFRGSITQASLPASLRQSWATAAGKGLTAPVACGGRIYAAVSEEHRIICLNAADGKPVWSFIAGGRVDSPPTICARLAIFGCRDGWVYAVSAENGELAWKFQLAPADKRIVVQEQIESLWPIYGSVLAENGAVYAMAGRHVDIDGGLWACALESANGKLLWSQNVRNQQFQVEHRISNTMVGEGGINDILRSDGRHAYVAGCFQKTALLLDSGKVIQKVTGLPILSTPNDMLTPASKFVLPGEWGDPTNSSVIWMYDAVPKRIGAGWWEKRNIPRFDFVPKCGYGADLFAFDGTRVFGAGREQDPKRAKLNIFGQPSAEKLWFYDPQDTPEHLQGMLVARDVVVAAFGGTYKTDGKDEQKGRILLLSAAEGTKSGEIDLAGVPRWDGMIVADGRLYISTEDGRLICLSAAPAGADSK